MSTTTFSPTPFICERCRFVARMENTTPAPVKGCTACQSDMATLSVPPSATSYMCKSCHTHHERQQRPPCECGSCKDNHHFFHVFNPEVTPPINWLFNEDDIKTFNQAPSWANTSSNSSSNDCMDIDSPPRIKTPD